MFFRGVLLVALLIRLIESFFAIIRTFRKCFAGMRTPKNFLQTWSGAAFQSEERRGLPVAIRRVKEENGSSYAVVSPGVTLFTDGG